MAALLRDGHGGRLPEIQERALLTNKITKFRSVTVLNAVARLSETQERALLIKKNKLNSGLLQF